MSTIVLTSTSFSANLIDEVGHSQCPHLMFASCGYSKRGLPSAHEKARISATKRQRIGCVGLGDTKSQKQHGSRHKFVLGGLVLHYPRTARYSDMPSLYAQFREWF
jgi:hypothetical protein